MTKTGPKAITLAEKIALGFIGEPNSGCWLWIKKTSNKGYGLIPTGSRTDGDRRWHLAHRASWEFFVGPIPNGLFVCHKCDTPTCINPAHLFLGTHDENMADAKQKKRMRNPFQASKLRCPSGHEYDVIIHDKRYGGDRRGCRECLRAASRRHYRNSKSKKAGD